jgi:uncharacterized protein (TIGR03118 family)
LNVESLEDRTVPTSGLSASLVADIIPGPDSSAPVNLTNVNGTLYFGAVDPATGAPALWKSDGTAAGTTLVADNQSPSEFTPFNGAVYYLAGGLWKTDGTSAGTVPVSTVPARNLTAAGGKLFFTGYTSTEGTELWASDGTAGGTALVKDIDPGTTTVRGGGGRIRTGKQKVPNSGDPEWLTNFNGKLVFTANDGAHGAQLWTSDGTTGGTHTITSTYTDLNPVNLTVSNGAIYFGSAGTKSAGLWKSDGTAAGTVMLEAFVPSTLANVITSSGLGDGIVTDVNGTLFFAADDGQTGPELWKTDGTAAGTVLVRDIASGPAGSSPLAMTGVNGELFLVANDGVHGFELWRSDGTAAGTVLVKDVNPGNADAFTWSPGQQNPALTNVNGLVYFAATDGSRGTELWQSDGTAAGTVLVQDINPGSASSYPSYLTAMNNKLYFAATDPTHGTELWDPPPVEGGGYRQTNLVGYLPGMARRTDPLLNGWGTDYAPGGAFCVANTSTRTATFYDGQGRSLPTVITIPSAAGLEDLPLGPTGVVYNPTADFVISAHGRSAPATFLFDTLDGFICGWNPYVDAGHAIVMVDNSAEQPFAASYTALTLAKNDHGRNVLYACDSGVSTTDTNNRIDMLDGHFHTFGSFTDTGVDPQMDGTIFQVEEVGGKLFVTFTGFSAPYGGVVDVFDTDGRLLTPQHFAYNAPGQGPLVAPWGIVKATGDFGEFSNDLLIGNVEGDGNINAFDPRTGRFLGLLKQPDGTPIAIPGLWDLKYGGGSSLNGGRDDLYFTAGWTGEDPTGNGLFGVIRAAEDGEDHSAPPDQGDDLAGAIPPLASGPGWSGQQTAQPAARSRSTLELEDRAGASGRALSPIPPGADLNDELWAPQSWQRKPNTLNGDERTVGSVAPDLLARDGFSVRAAGSSR